MICAICLKCRFKRPSPVFRQDLCVSLKQYQYLSQLSWINFIKFLAKQIVKRCSVATTVCVYWIDFGNEWSTNTFFAVWYNIT